MDAHKSSACHSGRSLFQTRLKSQVCSGDPVKGCKSTWLTAVSGEVKQVIGTVVTQMLNRQAVQVSKQKESTEASQRRTTLHLGQ